MELLNIRLIRLEATRNLKKNLARAISLVFVMLFSIIFMFIMNDLIGIFIRSFGITQMLTNNIGVSDLISVICSFVLGFTFIMPLWLNIKKWFMNLSEDAPPLATTLSLISRPSIYFKTISYIIIKVLLIGSIYFVLLTPSMALAAVVKSQINTTNGAVGLLIIIIFIMMVMFFIIAGLYAIYIALGFFYADYIYISKTTENPIKAIVLSLKIAKSNRMKIITLYATLIPYMLLSIFIIPLVFTIPLIQSTTACFARGQMEAYQYEQSQKNNDPIISTSHI